MMKTIKLFCLLFILSHTLFSQSNWASKGPVTGNNFYGLTFTDDSTAYAVSFFPANVFRSTNYANSWTSIYTFPNSVLKDVSFFNNQIGFVGGSVSGQGAAIWKTINSGMTWTQVYNANTTTISSGINDIEFYDSLNGYAVGGDGNLFTTRNAGQTWTSSRIQNHNLYSLKVLGLNQLLITTANEIINFNNGIFYSVSGNAIYDIDYYLTTVYAISRDTIYKSTNSGRNFTTVGSHPLPLGFANSICVVDDSNIYITGKERRIYFSSDGGVTWTLDITPVNSYNLFDLLKFGNDVWACGSSGQILQKQGLTTDISENFDRTENLVSVFPNPTQDKLYFKTEVRIAEVKVYNMIGDLVLEVNDPKESINMSSFRNGYYIVQMNIKNKVYTKKILKY